MGDLSDGRRLSHPVDAHHHKDKGFRPGEVDREGLLTCLENPGDLLLDKSLHLFGFFEITPFQSLTDTFDQLGGGLDAQICLKQENLQFIKKVLVDRLFPEEKLIDLFDKTLMGFGETLL